MRLVSLFALFLSISACGGADSETDDTGGTDTGTVNDSDGDGIEVEEDCDDSDENVGGPVTWYQDLDRDGYGDPGAPGALACEGTSGQVADSTDCDDLDAAYHPGAIEDDCADPNDYNCDEVVAYADGDSDGWAACVDCNDTDAQSNPEGVEVCNGQDDNCDGTVDEVVGLPAGSVCVIEFNDCAATGYQGPTQDACNAAYTGTGLAGLVTVSAGLQEWRVPSTRDYRIEAWGAMGASATTKYVGGSGAYAAGVFGLMEGDILTIAVGQRGSGVGSGTNGGGGGGTFVVINRDTALVVAGGGGGTRGGAAQNGCGGRADNYGGLGSGAMEKSSCAASTDTIGDGGSVSSVSWGSGGGGFNSAGHTDAPGAGGSAFVGGAEGANTIAAGGFGGGGSGEGGWGGGGGGGYTGGQGGWIAGGGGSYVERSATEASLAAGVNADDGAVKIQPL